MIFKKFWVEVRLASMMRAPSPCALRFGTLFASVRLALFKTKVSVSHMPTSKGPET